ncbi:MAG: hypothetical protein V4592_04320 [Bacteroidota bacterium]
MLILLLPLFSKAQDKGSDGTSLDIFALPPPKFLALRNAKLSIGMGLEGAFPAMMKSTVNPSELSIHYKDTRPDNSKYPYIAGGITVDMYSSNSVTGLLGGLNYSVSTTTYQKEKIATDYFSINRIEVPLYLKLRPGAIASKKHLWLMLGGIFSMPVKVNRQYVVNSSISPNGLTFTDTNVSQVSDLFLVSGSFGYEGYVLQQRSAIFLSGAYSLNSQFNTEYIGYSQPGNVAPDNTGTSLPGYSVFSNFPNYNSHELRLTLGIKVFFKLSKD